MKVMYYWWLTTLSTKYPFFWKKLLVNKSIIFTVNTDTPTFLLLVFAGSIFSAYLYSIYLCRGKVCFLWTTDSCISFHFFLVLLFQFDNLFSNQSIQFICIQSIIKVIEERCTILLCVFCSSHPLTAVWHCPSSKQPVLMCV